MSTRLTTLCFDASDPLRLARFWAAALSWDIDDESGNEFCVVQRGEFLATTGLLGSIVFEPAGYPAVGRFWSEATGWPVI